MNELVYGYLLARRTLVLAGVLLVSCCALWAQNDSPPASQMQRRGGGPERELQQLTQVLSLTGDQQMQVKTLLAAQREKMEALRRPASGGDASSQAAPPPSREQMEAIRQDTDTKITALLNDDQKPRFAAWQQQRKEAMEHRRGPGGDSAPQPPNN
jgi:periplasmic protein CpxP/Spy